MPATSAVAESVSLDILEASKASDNSIKVWTTENNLQQNDLSSITDLRNTASSPDLPKSSLYLKRMAKANGLPQAEDDNKEKQLKPQISEVKLTWFQKLLTWRFVIVLLLQSSFVVVVFLMTCLPMAMVCMVRSPTSLSSNSSFYHGSSGASNTTNADADFDSELIYHNSTLGKEDSDYEFDWNSEVQGLVLSSIMFTTFIGPMLMSLVKDRLGDKWTLSIFNLISTLLTFLSPMAARMSPYCLVAVRIVLGISLGGNVPVIGEVIAWWAPQDEKLTMMSLIFTGVNIGSILAFFLSGYLCLVPVDNGWPFVFYTFGTVSLLWGFCWHFLSSLRPEEHPYITEKEKQYIISHRVGMDAPPGGKKVRTPYRRLLTSYPVLAFLVSGICHIWSSMVLLTYQPVFMKEVMKFSVQETGMLTSLTSFFRMIGSIFWAVFGNKMASIVGINRSRKLCVCIGFLLAGVTTIVVGFFDDSYKWVVLGLLIFIMLNQAVGSSTLPAVPLDMAPKYAGLLTGMYASFGSFISISGPLLTAFITTNGTHEEWRTVWIIMGSLFIAGATIFLVFGQASIQPWAQGKSEDMPHIVSQFVTLGHRFSAFLEASPRSPLSPKKIGIEVLPDIKVTSTSMLTFTSHDITTGGIVNETFETSQDNHAYHSEEAEISRL